MGERANGNRLVVKKAPVFRRPYWGAEIPLSAGVRVSILEGNRYYGNNGGRVGEKPGTRT